MSLEPESDEGGKLRVLVSLVLAAVVLGGAFDLYMDAPADWLSAHVLAELSLILLSTATGVLLWRAWRQATTERIATARSLTAVEEDRRAWRQRAESALMGLRRAIDEQFDAWGLTPAEREVALLLLKGEGHKQIAGLTNRSASTVRQHAVSVYGKSGQAGRAELAAFFLEGLLHPIEPATEEPPTAPSKQ
jgi:DNA-binding CsgD family transcriptional regulator